MERKWTATKIEKYAEKWFKDNGFTFELVKQYVSKTVYNVYKDGSDTSDLHSMTGFGTFVGSTHMKAIRVHDDVDNKDYVFAAKSKCKVLRDGQETTCFASELLPTDHIIEHLKK